MQRARLKRSPLSRDFAAVARFIVCVERGDIVATTRLESDSTRAIEVFRKLLGLDLTQITVNGVSYPVATETTNDRTACQVVGPVGKEESGKLLTAGRAIYIPTETLLAFRIEDPIRLSGYAR